MHSPRDEAERVQFFITLGQQPGVGAWFTVWRVAQKKRSKAAASAALKKLPQGSCTA